MEETQEIVGLYATVETVKDQLGSQASNVTDNTILLYANAASRRIDQACRRVFLPYWAEKDYQYPPIVTDGWWRLDVGEDLLQVTTLLTQGGAVAFQPGQYFLEDQKYGKPYSRIEMNLANGPAFSAGLSIQRAIKVLGQWGFAYATDDGGDLADPGGINERATIITVTDNTLYGTGSVLDMDGEYMLVRGILGGNRLRVQRGVNGTEAASHFAGSPIQILQARDDIEMAAAELASYLLSPAVSGLTSDIQSFTQVGDISMSRFAQPNPSKAEEAIDIWPPNVRMVVNNRSRRRMMSV